MTSDNMANKDKIPVIAFSAWSDTGKTTLIERLTALFKKRGFHVAVIKHDAHDFEIDREGKDSWRFQQAGADMTVLCSETKAAVIEQRHLELSELLSLIHDVDLILVEGYNNDEYLPRIGISRRASGKGFRHPTDRYIALVTDEDVNTSLPVFGLDDIEQIADFIISDLLSPAFRRSN